MKITIQVLIEGADALPLTVPIQTIDRPHERIGDRVRSRVTTRCDSVAPTVLYSKYGIGMYLSAVGIADGPVQRPDTALLLSVTCSSPDT
jgi:hypothetical protein